MSTVRLTNIFTVVLATLVYVTPAGADYITPGTGVDWNLDQLVTASGGVVTGGGVHQRFRVRSREDMAQDLRQLGHAELTSSTRSVGELRQAELGFLVSRFVLHFAVSSYDGNTRAYEGISCTRDGPGTPNLGPPG